MTLTANSYTDLVHRPDARVQADGRNSAIDTMRGIAILMVIGIHSIPQPLDASWQKLIDAVLRPCVPVFLFASGYLTARSGRVILGKRIKTALIPYAIAFMAAYIYMAMHNSAMDHHITTAVARFVLAYVFVYYYVFVYVGCTAGLWLIFRSTEVGAPEARQRLIILLILSIVFGLIAGGYIDPLLVRLGLSDSTIEEVRLRNIPFWFCFAALGALVGFLNTDFATPAIRPIVTGAALAAYLMYASVRVFGIGDAADYDSVAFFGYAASFCILLFAIYPRLPFLAAVGSGSYFIYLWHIFVVMALRDHTSLHAASFVIVYLVTTIVSVAALMTVRWIFPSAVARWLGA